MPVISIRTDSSIINVGPIYYNRFNENMLEDTEVLSDFSASIEITHNSSLAQTGLNLFGGRLSNESGNRGNFLFVLDMQGNIKYSVKGNRFKTPQFINSTTVAYMYDGDIQLRNLETGVTETLPIPEGHHDIEYNPFTDTFLTLQHRRFGTYQGLKVVYDDIVEYDRQGNQVWFWNGSKNIPFNPDHFLNEKWGGGQDWTHGNTIFWLIEEDIIYFNPRNLDTFYKIDKQTGEIVWAVGKLGEFNLYDKHGKERETLWWHSHSVEMIGPNRFVLFDNDYQNQTNLLNHRSRLVEIVVDEEAMTATEVWSWKSPKEYYCGPFGDADRLPNGNTLGTFGVSYTHPAYLTEVTPDGKIAWEMKLDNSSEIKTVIYRSERFFEVPLIKIAGITDKKGENSTIDVSVWNTHRTRYHSKAIIRVFNDKDLLVEKSFEFLPHWQETILSLEVPYSTKNDLRFTVENSDGKTVEKNLSDLVGDNTTTNSGSTKIVESSGFIITSLGSFTVGVITLSSRHKRLRKK